MENNRKAERSLKPDSSASHAHKNSASSLLSRSHSVRVWLCISVFRRGRRASWLVVDLVSVLKLTGLEETDCGRLVCGCSWSNHVRSKLLRFVYGCFLVCEEDGCG
ncbi:hypothetical protein A4A49_06589 [Nicotiana attenuata]|uniref:Uncharacterized protein n=1 Tax=Nicotiana attenuata TaxID=49451 RepID=A0A1J6IF74_NICAT|nr:hypothetical protein A4A49_06589 [Nicotiana attenuata]